MKLPFEDGVFNGAICSGSLYLFPDPLLALREIGRTLRPKAPLAVQTFMPKKQKPGAKETVGFHDFHQDELLRCMEEAGFEDFAIKSIGTVLEVRARLKGRNG